MPSIGLLAAAHALIWSASVDLFVPPSPVTITTSSRGMNGAITNALGVGTVLAQSAKSAISNVSVGLFKAASVSKRSSAAVPSQSMMSPLGGRPGRSRTIARPSARSTDAFASAATRSPSGSLSGRITTVRALT